MSATGATGPAATEGNVTPVPLDETTETGMVAAGMAKQAHAKGIKCDMLPAKHSPGPKLVDQGQTPQTDADPDAALAFLDDFFGPDKRHLVAIRKNNGNRPDIKAHHFDAGDRAGQQKFITDCSAAGFDVYFSPNPIKGTLHKKAKKSDVAEARHLWIDLDPRSAEPLEAERAELLALLTTNLPEGIPRPNRVIDSGRGYWGYWKLATPRPVDGSTNNVSGPLTEAVESYGRVIETGELARVLHQFSHEEPHAIGSFPRTVKKPKDQETQKGEKFKPSAKYETIDPDEPALAKIDQKWSHADYAAAYGGDRSRAAFGFVCEYKRAGIADDVIARCLMHWPIGTCLREKPNVDRELIRILARGYEFAIDPKLAEMNEKHHVVLHCGKTRAHMGQ